LGLSRRLDGLQAVADVSLDVFDNDDGVIHDDADG
jgi:hypothetical protein